MIWDNLYEKFVEQASETFWEWPCCNGKDTTEGENATYDTSLSLVAEKV